MKITMIRWIFFLLNTLAFFVIIFLFIMSFLYPAQGPEFIIYSAVLLAFIGALLVIIHVLERKNESHRLALYFSRRYLSATVKIVLLAAGFIAWLFSLLFFIFSANGNFLINCGCYTAFIMIIILIELFIRILLPLSGVDQNA